MNMPSPDNLDALRARIAEGRARLGSLLAQSATCPPGPQAESVERELSTAFEQFGTDLDGLDELAVSARATVEAAAVIAAECAATVCAVSAHQQRAAIRQQWQDAPDGWPQASPSAQAATEEMLKKDQLKGEPAPVNKSNWSWLTGLFRPATPS